MNAQYVEQLYKKLMSSLANLNGEISNPVAKQSAMALKSKAIVVELRTHIIESGFDSIEEEIHFFKEIKPKFSALIYFHEKAYTIEFRMPHGTAEQKSMFLAREISKIDNFYFNNIEFSSYMKKGSTTNDSTYFVVGNGQLILGLGYDYLDFDPQFGSIHSSLAARFIGAQMALEYISKKLATIEGFGSPYIDNSTLDYDGTNTELIELAYALHKSGRIKSDIKEIVSVFETLFSTTIKDPYRTYHDFKSRKIDRTKFLTFLKKELNDALDRES